MPSFRETSKTKWIILPLCLISCFGSEFSFDNPGALKELLTQHFSSKYNPQQFEIYFSLFYSCLAIPNVILPFIIGYFTDKLGVRILYITLAILSVIGQSLVSLGINYLSLSIIYPGRMILGIACESMAIIQGIFFSQYFARNYMSLIVGGVYSLANFGGVLNSYYTPSIAANYGITNSFWVGSLLCAFAAGCALIGCFLDKRLETQQKKEAKTPIINDFENCSLLAKSWELKTLETDDDSFEEIQPHHHHHHEASEVPSLLDLKGYPKLFWYLCVATFLIQGSIQSFDVIGASYITDKWFNMESVKRASEDSGEIFSMFRLSSFLFAPVLGYIVDKTSERSLFFMYGCIIAFCSHLLVINMRPLIPCMLFGMSFTLIYASCWPFVMQIVKKEHVGKACGLVASLENVGLLLFPIIDGWLKNTFGSYDDSQIFLAVLAAIGSVLGIMIYQQDSQNNDALLFKYK